MSTDQNQAVPAVEVCGNSPERIYVTEANRGDENVRRHIARYEFAARHILADSEVFDCACGSGYGTEILSRLIPDSWVMGIDNSPEAIAYAKINHHCPGKTHYGVFDITSISNAGEVDAVVCLETIEHVPPSVCQKFLTGAASIIKPGGVIVASSPMLRYRDGKPYVTSPYHINEMSRNELLLMLVACFPMREWVLSFYHQEQEAFLPLLDEREGFCVVVGRKRLVPWREKE